MFFEKITPRFTDTDALGHVNNVSISAWFEAARRPLFELFIPDLSPQKWNLIIARVEVDYLGQTYFEYEVTIKSYFEKIGNSSMTLVQEVFQNDESLETKCDYCKTTYLITKDEIKTVLGVN